MKQFGVSIPITGIIYVEVEAENEEDAIDVALDSRITVDDIEQWEPCRQIVQGNFFYGMQNEIEVEEI